MSKAYTLRELVSMNNVDLADRTDRLADSRFPTLRGSGTSRSPDG